MKNILNYILFGLALVLCVFLAYKTYTLKEKVEYITDTIQVCDTVVNWQYDTVYFNRFDTLQLPVVRFDTINDTLLKTDSVFVQIPYYTYQYDTVIHKEDYETSLKAVLSGFNCQMDSLYLNTKIMPQKVKKEPWYNNIGVGIGLMYGTGGCGIGCGIMFKIF